MKPRLVMWQEALWYRVWWARSWHLCEQAGGVFMWPKHAIYFYFNALERMYNPVQRHQPLCNLSRPQADVRLNLGQNNACRIRL